MRAFVLSHILVLSLATILIGGALYVAWQVASYDPLSSLTTTTISRGPVEQIVSVSGVTRSRNTAELAFPEVGVVATVAVEEGDAVAAGTLLATLSTSQLVADQAKALADLRIAEAELQELLNGERPESRAVTETTVASAEAELARARTNENLAVENAKRTLYSSDLIARTENSDEDAPAPTISGTYRCEEAGTYTLRVYSSNSPSGYSVAISGLESGTFSVSSEQPIAFGTCGLFAQLGSDENYNNSVWTISIPNQGGSSYITNQNALIAAEAKRSSAIAAAEEALTLAQRTQTLENAPARSEAVTRAEARVSQASALLARANAMLADRSIIAPFAGEVTTVDILAGETAGTAPVITLLATGTPEVVARVPEIDITRIKIGQLTRVIFDARSDQMLPGTVSYIAPLPILIDGVAYFEIKIQLEAAPDWIRGGLNADIDIVTESTSDTLRLPIRYLSDSDGITTVRTLSGTTIATTTVTRTFTGNDGFVAITGLPEGTLIVAP